ncbi:MAG: fused MFS/spermidine synthase [Chthoniobacter sp.]|uniref:spermidine synthase n=1 Tax=Chthoniobacter sp. TaxID=2510640 RepID=UPI0032AC80B6
MPSGALFFFRTALAPFLIRARLDALASRPPLRDDPAAMTHGERVLVARHSAFQAILLTENAAGMRTLRFGAGGHSQSVIKVDDPRHLELPYARVLPACLAFVRNPLRVLIVGLGGGTIPRFLHSHFPQMRIDVVELDQEVLNVAREHCGFEEDERMRVSVDDGRDFIEASAGGYDIIILDCFDAETIPPHLATLEFLHRVRRTLSPGGMVVANIWGRASNPLYAHMLLTYRAAFADVYVFDVPQPGTKLFVGLPAKREMSREEVIATAREICRRHQFGYDLSASIAGFRDAALETARGGSVLRD